MDEPSAAPDWPIITEHLRLIRRYLGWICFVVLLSLALSLMGAFAWYVDQKSQDKYDQISCILDGTC